MAEISEALRARIAKGLKWIKETAQESSEDLMSKTHAVRDAFLAEVEGLNAEELSFPEGDGKWSINQVCLHVARSFPGVAGLVRLLARGTALPDAGPEVMGLLLEDPGDFDEVRRLVAEALDACADSAASLDGESNEDVRTAHPLFGPLNCREWSAFNIMHADIHVRQIQRIKGSKGYPG